MNRFGTMALFSVLALSSIAAAQQSALEAIRIVGNSRVEQSAIRVRVRSGIGKPPDPAVIEQDVRSIYAMGFFEDVQASVENVDDKLTLSFRVVERPMIQEIKIEGNKKVDTDDLQTAFKVRPHTLLDVEKIQRGIEDAKKLYDKKGYKDAAITFTTSEPENGEVTLTLHVDEGKIIRVQHIIFEGNREIASARLRGLMQTKEKSILSWATGAGNLDQEVLKTDVERLTAYYYDSGFVNVKVDEPQVERKEDGLDITIKIEEGDQFKVGEVTLGGDVASQTAAVLPQLAMKKGEVFRASNLRKDVLALTESYGNYGYAFVNVEPITDVENQNKVVDIVYKVDKGPEVYFDRIEITGNTKTKDEVIRRELLVQEQQRFNGAQLKSSRARVQRLGLFQEVNMTTQRSPQPDKIDLLVDVKEAQTGAFTAGAGFSTADHFLFNVRLSENNLFGTGDRVVVNADFGSQTRNFSLSYTDPYTFNTYFTTQFEGFNYKTEFDDFDREGTGFSIQALYPFTALGLRRIPFIGASLDEVRFGLQYKLEDTDITNLTPGFIIPSITEEQGRQLTSSVIPTLVRNTLNHPFDPTEGSFQNLSLQFAGVGAGTSFLLAEGRTRFFYPFYKSQTWGTFVASTGARVGWGIGEEARSGKDIPLFERFFPGGINSVRGYEARSLGPREPVFDVFTGQIVDTSPVGGSIQLINNNEIIFPIVESIGLRGVLFFDLGNAWAHDQGFDLGDLRYAAGWGVRWLSPVGPLRLEIGYPLNKRPGDRSSVFQFAFGAPL